MPSFDMVAALVRRSRIFAAALLLPHKPLGTEGQFTLTLAIKYPPYG